jgi:hypothetical protein
MRTRTVAFCLVKCTLLSLISTAKGDLMVSNLNQEPTRTAAIASDAWIAQPFGIFVTDPNPYVLDYIQLRLDPASGDPDDIRVSIYGAVSGIPQLHLGDLLGPDDPSAAGIYTYSASGITVSSGIDYYVVVRAATPISQGSYNWSGVDFGTVNGTWRITARAFESSDGLNWTVLDRLELYQIAIHATLVPEPSTLCLAGLGLGVLWLRRRSARSAASSGANVHSPAIN